MPVWCTLPNEICGPIGAIENNVQNLPTENENILLQTDETYESGTFMKFTWLNEKANEYLTHISEELVTNFCSKLETLRMQ